MWLMGLCNEQQPSCCQVQWQIISSLFKQNYLSSCFQHKTYPWQKCLLRSTSKRDRVTVSWGRPPAHGPIPSITTIYTSFQPSSALESSLSSPCGPAAFTWAQGAISEHCSHSHGILMVALRLDITSSDLLSPAPQRYSSAPHHSASCHPIHSSSSITTSSPPLCFPAFFPHEPSGRLSSP